MIPSCRLNLDQENAGTIDFEGFLEMLASHTADMELDKELVAGQGGLDWIGEWQAGQENFHENHDRQYTLMQQFTLIVTRLAGYEEEDPPGSNLFNLGLFKSVTARKITGEEVDRFLERVAALDPVTNERLACVE
eukprot:765838-Hanusia_phi.AAC.7